LELKWKYLAECVTGKLLQVDTLTKGSSSVKSLWVSVLTCAWDVVKYCITIHFFYWGSAKEEYLDNSFVKKCHAFCFICVLTTGSKPPLTPL
jgi:hypothetical protein